ncbi:c-type cytochrome [Luteithermobacter gelatinilyticus]|uniref:c-type cytochrome n=1 Tax=Luteithermobacter gelatinilyticus TaxID=2582913 RepID=UPI001105B391|nr:cytochrome c family protein [Luteithermobacter gelatinilyticus]
MDSFELNKIALAVLVTLLVIIGFNNLGDIIFHEEPLEKHAYPIEVEMAAVDTGGEAVEEEGPSLAQLLAEASVEKGQKVFKKCQACHTVEEGGRNGTGPNLWNVVGRPKGAVAGFGYSDALLATGGNWTYEDLDRFLAKPRDFIPGTKMAFAGLKRDSDRADVILYLRSLSHDQLALPEVGETAEAAAEGAAAASEEATQ